jgi:hypothetical protein
MSVFLRIHVVGGIMEGGLMGGTAVSHVKIIDQACGRPRCVTRDMKPEEK